MDVPSRFKKISEWLEETDDYGDIHLHKNDETGIALLYLNNPSKRNALTGKIMSKFSKLITELETWKKGKALIVYGSRNFFCSGLNLNLVKQIIGKDWHSAQMALLMTDNFRRLRNLSLITIALVEGKALGGGAEFVANLDMRIFTEKAQIGFVHKKMGISTAWTGAISLTKLLGPFKAIEILLSARLVGAEEAFNLGLANYVISSSTIASPTNEDSNVVYHFNQPNAQQKTCNNLPLQSNTVKQIEAITQLDPSKLEALRQLESLKETFELKQQLDDQNNPINIPILKCMNVSNENRTNYCKKIFKRLKKKDEDKEKFAKRCKLDVDICEKIKVQQVDSNKLNSKLNKKMIIVEAKQAKQRIKKCNESSKMFKRMKRILFDAEEKFVIKPDIELSSCSEDEVERVQPISDVNNSSNNSVTTVTNKPVLNTNPEMLTDLPLIQDGQPKFKVGLSEEDDNTILNLVYNWLARLTACLEQENCSELKQLVREPRSCESVDLLSHLNMKLFNQKMSSTSNKCKVDTENKWPVLKSINSVNQTV